jgi:hypothetical protein
MPQPPPSSNHESAHGVSPRGCIKLGLTHPEGSLDVFFHILVLGRQAIQSDHFPVEIY